MDFSKTEQKISQFQARARGYLVRREVRHAREDFEEIVAEIDGDLKHLRWREAVVSIPDFTDTCFHGNGSTWRPVEAPVPVEVFYQSSPEEAERDEESRPKGVAQDVACTPEVLRLHRNTLTMELLWLQQAIDSRKKYLSLKDRLSS